jgi:hypothetical protein
VLQAEQEFSLGLHRRVHWKSLPRLQLLSYSFSSAATKSVGAYVVRSTISVVAAVVAVLSAPAAFAAGPFGSIHVGNWNGGADADFVHRDRGREE